ncbi:MAG: transcription antitermination factor NusB [Bryobacterales bacterium]|nr:transcription antitermination factor NusB [Bryobacterales bacterium]
MPSRHRKRRRALQVLFSWDARGQAPEHAVSVEEALAAFYDNLCSEESDLPAARDDFVERLVRAAVSRREEIDRSISKHAEHWRIERMPAVDRNILRLAIAEMLNEQTPAAVVIDEALELARRFSSEESVHFINAVLDAVRKDLGAAPS